ncbi:MAG: hypothetical protein E3J72_18965 [Planctomycetota bacterium]|nr:MAG: hypothetical protein E3J72_18965 [Planctomycetota bacterium]
MAKMLPILFALMVIAGAVGALVVGMFHEAETLNFDFENPDLSASTTWMLVDELLDSPPGMNAAGNSSMMSEAMTAALKKEVLTTGNESEFEDGGSGLAGGPGFSAPPSVTEYKNAFEALLNDPNLPEFLKNMSVEERAEFLKFFSKSVRKEVEKARKRAERKELERKRKMAIRRVSRRMKFSKYDMDYIRRQEQLCWKRIKELTQIAKENKTRRRDLYREVREVRKQYRGDMDENLGDKRYSRYLDQVHRQVDPTYANRADIEGLKKKVNGMQKSMNSLRKQMNSALKRRKRNPKPRPPQP